MNKLRILMLLFALSTSTIAQNNCKIWNDFVTKKGVGAILPDFSYAGVNYSETPLPTPNYKVFKVDDFGAIPNDGKSDRNAIIKAIRAAEANGSGIIQFSKGRYRILEDEDKKEPVFIKSGRLIFRGAGHMEGGTEIFMKNHMQKVQLKSDKVTGKYGKKIVKMLKPIFISRNKGMKKEVLAKVTKDAVKGERTIKVDTYEKLQAGQWIVLTVENNNIDVIKEALSPMEFDNRWKQIMDIGVTIKEVHKIKSVNGNKITFCEPLRFNMKSKWKFTLRKTSFLEGIGIENIAFVGNYRQKFKHHGSAIHDGGWHFWKLVGILNSWIKDCRFKDCNGTLSFTNSAYCTAYNIIIEGFGGHTSIRESGSTGVLIAKVNDKAHTWHAVGVAKPGIGNVIWRCKYPSDRCFEIHATQPRASLFDCIEGGFERGFAGGAVTSLPNHLNDLVLWNFKETGKKNENFNFISIKSKYWRVYPPIIVGFHGVGTTFNPKELQYIESLGKPVKPQSLFEAQLKLRLGKIPYWLNK